MATPKGSSRAVYAQDLTEATIRRFWKNVEKSDECWRWTGRPNDSGYGTIHFNGHTYFAHRVSYAMAHGTTPADLFVCHSCDNPPCVNPAHLFLGTVQDNNSDMMKKGRNAIFYGDEHWTRRRPELVPQGFKRKFESIPRGEKTYNHKLTWQDVREIRASRAAGATLSSISKRFGICSGTIHGIVTFKTWKHDPQTEVLQ